MHIRLVIRFAVAACTLGLGPAGFAGAAETPPDVPDVALPPMSVRGTFVKPELPSDRMRLEIFLNLQGVDVGWGIPGWITTPGRAPQTIRNIGYSLWTLDDVRARSSVERPPTLRGLAVTVLRDRFPAANAFDGSVPWAEIPSLGTQVETIPGGGATAWDAGANGGAIQFLTLPASLRVEREKGNGRGQAIDGGPLRQRVLATGTLAVTVGELGTREVEWNFAAPTIRGIAQVQGGVHATNGFDLLSRGQRGLIDEAAWSRGQWLETRWRQPIGKKRALTVTARGFENATGQGTPGQHREEQGTLLSVAMIGSEEGGLTWHGGFFVQHDDAQATLSSIDALRSGETPARRLEASPSTAVGASWTGSWWHLRDARTTLGLDFRHIRGESRETFSFDGRNFLQESVTGGERSTAAVLLLRQQPLGESLRTVLGVRLEAWDDSHGHRLVTDRVTGSLGINEAYTSRHGTDFVPTASVAWQIDRHWQFRANAQATTRQPTLAQRFQTWGAQGILVEATPDLIAEKNVSFEAGLAYSGNRQAKFEAALFNNRVSDFLGSYTVAPTSGSLPGLSVRKRINVPHAEIKGLQLSARLPPMGPLSVDACFALTDSRLSASPTSRPLEGKGLAFTPRQVARLNAQWQFNPNTQLGVSLRAEGRQFADEENTRRLAAAVRADLALSHRWTKMLRGSLRVENATGKRAETNRDANGWVYLGPGRVVRADITYDW